MKQLARTLRKHQTDAERLLWSRLRNRQLEGCKFLRQHAIGRYIADFLCLEPKLVIELDGGQHVEQIGQDKQRTRYFQSLGYRVLRFWNHEVLCEPHAVLEVIRAAVTIKSPRFLPLPLGEGGGEGTGTRFLMPLKATVKQEKSDVNAPPPEPLSGGEGTD